ncbi:hypothetical protein CRM79_13350 [Pantoea agglomerans]|uniref:hypothetical protein n=1 Tax=Pantoea vagans TaxID=470934 RepID=UPI000BEF8528|nr:MULTISPECIES: hypothetical protein [Pantoea]MDE8559145.1 hypothetical protein [Pantoea vagans]MDE8579140.1 hypothetical protein [Pantoea vagans]PEI04133.1 hypothetical protein CRM79_13350 [Pantoea agglomerans]
MFKQIKRHTLTVPACNIINNDKAVKIKGTVTFCGYADESAIAFIFLLLLKAILVIPSSPLFSLINQRFVIHFTRAVLLIG